MAGSLRPKTVCVWAPEVSPIWMLRPCIFPCEGRVDRAVMELALYVPRAPITQEERTHWDKNMQLVLDVVTGEDFQTRPFEQIDLRLA